MLRWSSSIFFDIDLHGVRKKKRRWSKEQGQKEEHDIGQRGAWNPSTVCVADRTTEDRGGRDSLGAKTVSFFLLCVCVCGPVFSPASPVPPPVIW